MSWSLFNIEKIDIGRVCFPWRVPSVLIVEDNKVVATCIRLAAEAEGFRAVVTETAEEALGVLHHNGKNYVCAVIDVRLAPPPAMDGWELWHEIKVKWPEMPARMISIDFDNFRSIPRGVPVTIMVKNGHQECPRFYRVVSTLFLV